MKGFANSTSRLDNTFSRDLKKLNNMQHILYDLRSMGYAGKDDILPAKKHFVAELEKYLKDNNKKVGYTTFNNLYRYVDLPMNQSYNGYVGVIRSGQTYIIVR